MSKKRIISVLLALTLMLSVLPVDTAQAAVLMDFANGTTNNDISITKYYSYEPAHNVEYVYVSPGDKVTLTYKMKAYKDGEPLEFTNYVWRRQTYRSIIEYAEKGLIAPTIKVPDCNDKTFTFTPNEAEIFTCEGITDYGYNIRMTFYVNMDMGLSSTQNLYTHLGNEGESVSLKVDSQLINPKGKVSYEWYSEYLEDPSHNKLEKLSSTGKSVSVKVKEYANIVISVVKYTEGKYTQIEEKYFIVTPFSNKTDWHTIKGSDIVAAGENVSVYTNDASKIDWYDAINGNNEIMKSGVSSIKLDKPGLYYYIDQNRENDHPNMVFVYKKCGSLELNKPVTSTTNVKEINFEGYEFTPSVSGEYSVQITNNPNVDLVVMNKKSVLPREELVYGYENCGFGDGDKLKNKNAYVKIHMMAGETYLIMAEVKEDDESSTQSYQLRVDLAKNGCKHGSSFVADDKAATLFTKGVTGEKRCGWCNEILKKGKTINKKTIKLSAKAIKKGAKLSWKKQTGIAGYQLRYATNKSFKKAKTVVASKKSISKTLSKLTSKKKYYFAIRAYKKSGKKKVYSSWSKTVSIKVK